MTFQKPRPFLDRYCTTTEEESKICRIASELKLDFDDALQYFVARSKRLTLVTFDRDFLKVKGIKILFPQ